jgi:TonB-dependent receptor
MKTTRLIACFVLGILTPGTILAQESDPELEGAEEAPPIEAGPRAEPAPATEPPADETDDLFTRAPARGKGAIAGLVSDDKTGEGVFDAQIAVVGRKEVVTADVDGRFRLELPPGTYALRVYYELYSARRVQNVTVTAGGLARVDVSLAADEGAVETVEIEAAPDRSSRAAQLVLRRNAPRMGDALSAQEIARTPDKNAAEAAKRIVGATIVSDRYLFVRGLGDRYTNAQLNGAPLPSPEPDRQAVPLDLFPAVALADLTVAKTFTPDIPGDFAGGSLSITTREPPRELLAQVTLSIGVNTRSTFRDRLTYPGSSLDWLGIDAGTRALPSDIPDYKVVKLGPKPDGSTVTRDELTAYGRSMNAYMSTRTTTTLPNGSGNMVVGNSHDVGGGRVGYLAALTYGRRFPARDGEIIRTYAPDSEKPGALRRLNDYSAETGTDSVSWGALGTLRYERSSHHALTLTGLHSRSSEDQAREISGFNEERAANIRDTRLRFVSRALTFGNLAGDHTFPSLGKARLQWNLSLSRASSDEPDTRETVYVEDATSGVYSFDRGTLSGAHFFGEQSDSAYGGGVDWTQPLAPGDSAPKLKLGALLSRRSRDFEGRRFRYVPRSGVAPETFRLPPDQLFTDENIGTALELEEYTRQDDSYDASQGLVAGYLMTDVAPTRGLRVVAGVRVEKSALTLSSYDPFAAELTETTTEKDDLDLMPSLSLVVKTSETTNLRFAVSRTVARPELRELSPFAYTDYFGAREVLGNPELSRTRILNGDVRFEVFPGSSEVLAASLFYKRFEDPIEQIIIPSNRGIITYQNAEGATNLGLELEAQKGLGFIHASLRDLSLLANLTGVWSRVELAPGGIQTNAERPLAGQSPLVVNLGLDYANDERGTRARVLYNVFGSRIAQVGASGLPDVYEQPFHKVDLTAAQRLNKHLDLKLSVENLLDWPVLRTQGEDSTDEAIVSEYRVGTTVSLGITGSY